MQIPEELRYSSDHEWASRNGKIVRIGITDFAQDALGDVVYVEVPAVGTVVAAGAGVGEVESTKSVSEIYAPVAGTIVSVNANLSDSPEAVNADPYGDGWLCEIELSDESTFDGLLDADGYRSLTEG
ncbi:MAG: glycine cleavage system protein GcvH [Actinomycetes bacterium]|jgi:glycine cleavage system H protein